MDQLNKGVSLLREHMMPENMIIVRGMTSEQFEEYASKLTKAISSTERSMDGMAIIGGELAPIFAKVAESFLEAKREFENERRECLIIVLDHFMPESWARYIVSKIPNRIIWWTIR